MCVQVCLFVFKFVLGEDSSDDFHGFSALLTAFPELIDVTSFSVLLYPQSKNPQSNLSDFN